MASAMKEFNNNKHGLDFYNESIDKTTTADKFSDYRGWRYTGDFGRL